MAKERIITALIVVLVVAFVVPQIALAAWWNPMSWGWVNSVLHNQACNTLTTLCPDGSSVSARGPNCKVPACPPGNCVPEGRSSNSNLHCCSGLTFKTNTPGENIGKCVKSIDQTTDWKTYTNTQYGFEFSVPNWIDKYNSGNGIFNAPGVLGINVDNLGGNQALQEYINKFLKNQGAYKITQKNVTVGGKNGVMVNYYFDASPGSLSPETNVYVPLKSGEILDVSSVDSAFDSYSTNAVTFDSILSTFKITK
jgi:hypothetical protein